MTHHATARLNTRSIDPRLIALAEYQASKCLTSTAIRLTSGQVNHKWNREDGSNGDSLWTIVRHQEIITFFWRRSSQPTTPDAFGVNQVVIYN